jgi:hypothetical protein
VGPLNPDASIEPSSSARALAALFLDQFRAAFLIDFVLRRYLHASAVEIVI